MTTALDRRAMLQLIGLAALGAGTACSMRRSATVRRRIASVLVAPDRVIRTVVGLRPYRPSGFVVRLERVGEKAVVHNYGHGGGGVTLSWGTAQLAADLAFALPGARRAAILGAGAVGLATARVFQRAGWDVSIYAKDLPPHTTSNVAGAQWSPSHVFDPAARSAAFDDQYERACRISYRSFQDLAGERYGVRWIENYELGDAPFDEHDNRGGLSPIRDLYPGLTDLAPEASPFDAPYVRRFFTMLIEPAVYLDALLDDVIVHGGRVQVRALESREDVIALPEPVVVNCTGLGARALFGDDELVPIQGQNVVLLPQPEVDYIALCRDLYMFPRSDGIVLGSTYRLGDWDLEVNPEATRRVLAGASALFEKLKRA